MSIDLKLDRIQALCGLLPAFTRPTCHIAGTNGKGSVCAITSSILRASGLSVGRFNSPHLVSVEDSISLNDEPVSSEVYQSTKARVLKVGEDNAVSVSSFELLVLTALQIFEQAAVDIVVLEVGMGGLLDATNIVPDEFIAVSALTAVDLDHQAFLGTTVSEIARHKAGIARRGRPFILGPQKYIEVTEAVRETINTNGAEMVSLCQIVPRTWEESIDGPEPTPFELSSTSLQPPAPLPVTIIGCFEKTVHTLLPLYGSHQLDNLAIAASVISALARHLSCARFGFGKYITPDSVSRGTKAVVWPGRLSFHRMQRGKDNLVVLADGAHNAASSASLSSYLTHLLSKISSATKTFTFTFILALSHSPPKTPQQTLSSLLPVSIPPNFNAKLSVNVALLRFTQPEGMPWVKSVPPQDLRDTVKSLSVTELWVTNDEDEKQLEKALEWAATKEPGLIVVAGSLYLVADLYRIIRLQ